MEIEDSDDDMSNDDDDEVKIKITNIAKSRFSCEFICSKI